MRMYKHWFKLNLAAGNREAELIQWNHIKTYLEKYPKSKATVYNKTTGYIFEKIICLECEQSYNDLDIDCNSMFKGSLIHLERKPTNIEPSKGDFQRIYDIYTRETA